MFRRRFVEAAAVVAADAIDDFQAIPTAEREQLLRVEAAHVYAFGAKQFVRRKIGEIEVQNLSVGMVAAGHFHPDFRAVDRLEGLMDVSLRVGARELGGVGIEDVEDDAAIGPEGGSRGAKKGADGIQIVEMLHGIGGRKDERVIAREPHFPAILLQPIYAQTFRIRLALRLLEHRT